MRGAVQAAVDGDGEKLLKSYTDEGFVDPNDPPTPDGILAWAREALTTYGEAVGTGNPRARARSG